MVSRPAPTVCGRIACARERWPDYYKPKAIRERRTPAADRARRPTLQASDATVVEGRKVTEGNRGFLSVRERRGPSLSGQGATVIEGRKVTEETVGFSLFVSAEARAFQASGATIPVPGR